MDILKIPPQLIPYTPIIPGIFSRYLNRVAGVYYGCFGGTASTASNQLDANKLYCLPFVVLQTESFDRISVVVQTAAAGGCRLGIYNDSNLAPAGLLLDAGEVDTSTTGTKEITINQSLSPGLYWLAAVLDNTSKLYGPNGIVNMLGLGSTSPAAGGNGFYCSDQNYGALPDPHPTTKLNAVPCPGISLRKA